MNMLKNIVMLYCVYAGSLSAEIYKWVDDQGHVHYGDKPVTNSEEMQVNIENKGNVKISNQREKNRQKLLDAYAEDQARENKEKEKLRKKKKKMKANCINSKDSLRRYERASSLYNLDKEGNRVTMSNAQRDKATNRLRAYISKYCK